MAADAGEAAARGSGGPVGELSPREIVQSSEEELPAAERRFLAHLVRETFHAGPLPPPATLAQYDRVMPGLAERLVLMAEREQAHRHYCERAIIDSDVTRSRWGLVAGFAISLLLIGAAGWLITIGRAVEGTALGGANIVALASVFVVGTLSRRGERKEKTRLVARGERQSLDAEEMRD